MRVIVVGAGVIGLSCAVHLAETGHAVDVLARDLPLETTSAVAAAWWYPYLAAPVDRVSRWGAATYDELARLATADPAAGVRMRDSVQLLRRPRPDPWWVDAVPSLHPAGDVPPGYAGGWGFVAPVADTSVYLPYLVDRLRAAGGTLTRMALSALPPGADVVVNAAGLAARSLTGDVTLTPVRGQVVRLAGVTVERVWLDEDTAGDGGNSMTYVVPRERDVMVGGTAEPGSGAPGPTPRPRRRCWSGRPDWRLSCAERRSWHTRVGLRPSRPSVRLEAQLRTDASPVVHCYGHGGAGVTLSWGCALEVAAIVEELG